MATEGASMTGDQLYTRLDKQVARLEDVISSLEFLAEHIQESRPGAAATIEAALLTIRDVLRQLRKARDEAK